VTSHGVWRSLVARFVRDEEAAGSNPVTPTSVREAPFIARAADQFNAVFTTETRAGQYLFALTMITSVAWFSVMPCAAHRIGVGHINRVRRHHTWCRYQTGRA
jgi:hypothetical protein